MPTVSVVICTHNRLRYLKQALRSVYAQTFSDFEIILSDDGSTDGTPRWIRSRRLPHLRYLRCDVNRGPAAAKNAALARTRGTFVAFLDSDDLWRPRHLESLLSLFSRPRIVLAFSEHRAIDSRGRAAKGPENWPAPASLFRDMTSIESTPSTSATVVRRTALRALGGFDERFRRYGDDGDLFLRLAARYGRESIAALDQVLVEYRLHGGQLGDTYARILRRRAPLPGNAPCSGWATSPCSSPDSSRAALRAN